MTLKRFGLDYRGLSVYQLAKALISGERLQENWSSGVNLSVKLFIKFKILTCSLYIR